MRQLRQLRDRDDPLKLLAQEIKAMANPHYPTVTKEGHDAALDGRQRADNPYPADSDYHRWWNSAFDGATKYEVKSIEKNFRKI